MKIYISILFIVLLFSCSDKKEIRIQYIGDVELEYSNFDEYHLDSLKILYPTGIHSFKKHLLLIEPKNNPTISFWSIFVSILVNFCTIENFYLSYLVSIYSTIRFFNSAVLALETDNVSPFINSISSFTRFFMYFKFTM